MRGYIKSATKTFDIKSNVNEITEFVHKQLSVDHPFSERIEKRYRITVAEIEDYDETTLLRIRRANLRNVKNVNWNGSKIIKNEIAKNE